MARKIVSIAGQEFPVRKFGKAWKVEIDGFDILTDVVFYDAFPDAHAIARVERYLDRHGAFVPKFKKEIIQDYRGLDADNPEWLEEMDVKRGLSDDSILSLVDGVRLEVGDDADDIVTIMMFVPWDEEHGLRFSILDGKIYRG